MLKLKGQKQDLNYGSGIVFSDNMYRLTAVVEEENGSFISHCIELGIASQGNTTKEAIDNLKDACQLYLKHADEEELKILKSKKDSQPLMTSITI